jgi:hypothetical protein
MDEELKSSKVLLENISLKSSSEEEGNLGKKPD